jgi:hypothetical protein
VVKISAQLEHFSVLVLKELKILLVKVNFGFLNLFLDIWIRIRIPNTDPDLGPNWKRIQLDPDPKHW